jgi:hypothetical protein
MSFGKLSLIKFKNCQSELVEDSLLITDKIFNAAI